MAKITRESILDAAKKCVCGQREEDYGSPEDNFKRIAYLWEIYLCEKCIPSQVVNLAPEDVAAMLCLLKVARIMGCGEKADNWIDLAGYAACGGELQFREDR